MSDQMAHDPCRRWQRRCAQGTGGSLAQQEETANSRPAARAPMRSRRAILIASALALALAGCSVPNSMHVTQGISPRLIDTDVRFRTTYYFRTFDYCWATSVDGSKYRQVIPETDVLYRYVMTGKAPALTNKVQFEAAVVDAAQLDPFGANLGLYNTKANEGAAGVAANADPAPKVESTTQTVEVDSTTGAVKTTTTETGDTCLGSLPARRGFMIMGPEGMVPFDQTKRLVLAMSSSAEPLVATLQEYAGRVIAANSGGAGQLVALVNEGSRARAAQEALAGVDTGAGNGATVDSVAQAALDAFTPQSETDR